MSALAELMRRCEVSPLAGTAEHRELRAIERLHLRIEGARLELARRLDDWCARNGDTIDPVNLPEALVVEHHEYPGDWTLWVPALARRFGRWPTREDARRAAVRSGFATRTKEETAS